MSMTKKHSYDIIKVTQINPSTESGGTQPYQHDRIYEGEGLSPALDQGCGRWSVKEKTNIRRLTEIECERLQGFKDKWTEFGIYDGEVKKISRTQRYKMIGNAVTVDVVELIAKKLIKCLM